MPTKARTTALALGTSPAPPVLAACGGSDDSRGVASALRLRMHAGAEPLAGMDDQVLSAEGGGLVPGRLPRVGAETCCSGLEDGICPVAGLHLAEHDRDQVAHGLGLQRCPRRPEQGGGFDVELDVLGDARPVRPEVQASVYRVAQEGIANAMKHSGAHACRIRLQYEADSVVIQVEDEGQASSSGTGSQLGLVGIRERAAMFGGRVEAGPRPAGDGWRLEVAFPL